MVTQPTPHQWNGHAKELGKRYVCNIPSSNRSLVMRKSPNNNDTIDNSVKQIDF